MKRIKAGRIFTFMVIALLAVGCDTGHNHEEEQADQPMHEDEVTLTKVQAQNIGISFDKISERNIQSSVKLIGRVELPPTGRAVISSKLEGEILNIHIIEGQRINKNQKVFTIQNMELIEWQEEWKKQQSKIGFLDKEIARQKQLSDESISPIKNYESLVSEREQAAYTSKAVEQKLAVLGKSISMESDFNSTFQVRASSGGILHELIASKGAFIKKGDPLGRIIDDHHLHIHLAAYSEDVEKLSSGQQILFNVQSAPNKIMKATIKWIDAFVNEENNSFQVHAEIDDEETTLVVGEFVEARIIDETKKVKTLPAESVIQDKGLHYIFAVEEVHGNEIHFIKLQVQLGDSDMGFVEIIPVDAIEDNAEIVVKGAFLLMAQSKKGEEGAGGHSH